MSRMPEVIVLLWFVPVALNIMLPLIILCGHLIGRTFGVIQKEKNWEKQRQPAVKTPDAYPATGS